MRDLGAAEARRVDRGANDVGVGAFCANCSCTTRAAGELDAVVQRSPCARRVDAEQHDAEHDERDGADRPRSSST